MSVDHVWGADVASLSDKLNRTQIQRQEPGRQQYEHLDGTSSYISSGEKAAPHVTSTLKKVAEGNRSLKGKTTTKANLGVEPLSHNLHRFTALSDLPSISSRRGFGFNLPEFNQLVTARSQKSLDSHKPNSQTDGVSSRFSLTALSRNDDGLLRSHSLGPLTPPHEVDTHSWSNDTMLSLPTEVHTDSADQPETQEDAQPSGRGLSLSQSSFPKLQNDVQLPSQGLSQLPWLDRALEAINRRSGILAFSQYIELASQVLPNHASDRRLVKTSEQICDRLQQTITDLQGITVTHAIAVPQSQVVEDFPKSPPSTPNFVITNGYFDEPIIVTKAANVPIYHGIKANTQEVGTQIQRRIMVRSIVDVALLERYIPPTTANEVTDLFNADSYRSYLADRLSELAIGKGSLILVYPTRSGGQTFARRCIGPVLDPLLRELSILRGLDTDAAQMLGSMESIDSMMSFEEMKTKVEVLCSNMSERSRALSVRSSYQIVHSDAAETFLDRNTWMTWFVEQEQQRMKQNLVDYHKDGGRLPQGDGGSSELTAGMLTREIIEGLQKSKQEVTNVGIEVGVFVIQRIKR